MKNQIDIQALMTKKKKKKTTNKKDVTCLNSGVRDVKLALASYFDEGETKISIDQLFLWL